MLLTAAAELGHGVGHGGFGRLVLGVRLGVVRRKRLGDLTGASPCGPIGQSLRCEQQV